MTQLARSAETTSEPVAASWLVDGTVPGDLGPAWGTSGVGAVSRAPGLVATADQVAAFRWLEHRLFEVVGRWSATETNPGAAALFAVLSRQHAWHAELFARRLPVLAGVDVGTVGTIAAPWTELLRRLGEGPEAAKGTASTADRVGDASSATLGRLVGLGRVVLPRLTTAYARYLQRLTPSEAPLVVVLRTVLPATRDAWTTVEAMVQDCLVNADSVAAAGVQEALERPLAARTADIGPPGVAVSG